MNRTVGCALVALTLAACGSSSSSSSSSPDAGVVPTTRPKATQCTPDQDGVFVGEVSGRVLDTTGKPPTNLTVTVCGSACIAGKLNVDGTFSVAPNFCYLHGGFYPVPVFIFHGEPEYTSVNVDFVPKGVRQLDHATIEQTVYTMPTSAFAKVLYDEKSPFTISDGKGFTVSAPAGAVQLPFVEDPTVRVAEADLGHFPLGSGKGGETLSALYVIMPDESKIDPPATVRFPNTAKLAPGSTVELLAIGNLVTAKLFAPGTLGVIGAGRVTADGTTVESVAGTDSGLITSGWIGYRPKR